MGEWGRCKLGVFDFFVFYGLVGYYIERLEFFVVAWDGLVGWLALAYSAMYVM